MKRLLALAITVLATTLAHAAPPAGTVIGNQATATYNDSVGTARTATSNLVQTTVTQVKSFTLTANGARTAAPGQTVYYPHTLTNTGNGTDTYALNAPVSSSFGAAGPHVSLAYFIDANGDGIPDNGAPITSSGAITAGGIFRFVVAGTVPGAAASGDTANITVSVSDTSPATTTNTDTTTVASSVITVTKSLSSNSGPSPAGPITVTLSYANTGTAAANSVQMTDTLNAAFTYVAGSGRWSVSGATILTDASDGVEQAVAFAPGIDYRSTLGAGATITAIIPSVPAGATGTVTFQLNVNAGLAPQTINNVAQYQTSSQLSVSTNTASYQVLQGASVVANGSNVNSANGTGEPVTVASAAAGSTFAFNNFIWNRGNGTDTFDIAIQANTFPAGTTFALMQQDGATPLINSGGAAAPDTGPIPGAGQPGCTPPFVADTTTVPNVCGYRVVVRVTLPANAPAGSYSLTKRATSAFNNTVFDDVVDTLSAVSANTVDITNDLAAPPAGAALVADGLGATGATVIRTNVVTPAAAASTPSRFRVWVTNTGLVSDTFNMTAVFAATSAAGVTPPALPAGWSVAFFADNSGAPANCTVLGASLTSTGALAPGTARLVCAQVTVSSVASGTAIAGNYDFDFSATSATNAAVSDVKRDRITVAAARSFTLAPNNAGQTFANGSVTYTHSLTNTGNATDTAIFAAGCLANNRAGWTAVAYVDANANGTLEVGTDTPIVCGTTSVTLNVGESRAVFVVATAPGSATSATPANITTITATYSTTVAATDTTSTTDGLVIVKEQQALGAAGCANNNAPAAGYAQGAIAASPATAPGSCIAYRITTTNTTTAPVTAITLADVVPANTRMHYACSGNGAATPSITVGAIAGTTPADGASGTVSANIATLNAAQSSVMYFCVQVDAAAAPATVIANTANGTGTQGVNALAPVSNTTTATVGTAAGATFSAVLRTNTAVTSQAGATVFISHTLTNTGTVPDTYTVTAAATNPGASGYAFTSITLFPDANGDGQPDGVVPLANPIVLAPGQVLRFVIRLVIPANVATPAAAYAGVSAASAGGAVIAPVTDTVTLPSTLPPICGGVTKSLSRSAGPSPSSALTVTLQYATCDKPRPRIIINDELPAGMRYVAGSGRSSLTGATPLTDGIVGDDRQGTGASKISYDWNTSHAGSVAVTFFDLPAQDTGTVSFAVEIEPGLAIGTRIENIGIYLMPDANGVAGGAFRTNPAAYTVTSSIDVTLTGQRLPSAVPGTTVAFTNVLTNKGDAADTFDITFGNSTFPPGTTIALFKSDGVTPLADTDGNGTPDTGPVAPGAAYNIVVKVSIPATAPAAAYKVTKTARSAAAPSRTASADDAVDTLETRCALALDPDNQALIGFGQHVTYTHHLTNRGNCRETVRAALDYLRDSKAGWTSAAYIDNTTAGNGSLPGVVDRGDVPIVQGWSQVLQPGESLRLLVDVRAPGVDAAAKSLAKQIVDSDVTTLVITGATVGPLTVHDTTSVDADNVAAQPDNAIRNFTDASYANPTAWGVVGRDLFLRADAASCNADPNAVEPRTVVITGPNGEREEATAVETGPNTGVFVVPALPVRAPPVTAGNHMLEGNPNDVFEIEILGCGRRIDTVVTLMQPVSVVFDSRTNEPVAGARVTLRTASGGQCSATTAPAAAGTTNPAITDASGRYVIQAAAGDYCLAVEPPNGYRFPSLVAYTLLPPGRNISATGLTRGGSYGNAFHVDADGFVIVDIPVDTSAQDGLFVQKIASRSIVEIGDFIDYTVRVRNGTGNALDRANVVLADDLPQGFGYVAGSARRDGVVLADPSGGQGPRVAFNLGHLDRGQEVTIIYRVRLGPGAMQGDGVNRVRASYSTAGTTTVSNIASATVHVTGGVFSDKGFILGKVFMDCNANGVQDTGERGVPGVRLLLEDGTFVITDGGGKFSFYGVSNRTHVVKADRTTLPAGARLAAISARHLGDGGSRIVDLKASELHRADFAIAGCDPAVVEEVKSRADALAKRTDELALAATQLATEARVLTDVKALPASGVVSAASPPGAAPSTLPGAQLDSAPSTSRKPEMTFSVARAPLTPVALETLVPDLDNKLDFIGLADGDALAQAQSAVRVKGTAGAAMHLSVNGVAIPDARVGKRSVLAEREVQAWEFIGVDFKPGENTLLLTQDDAFGNERGRRTIKVIAPDRLAKIELEVPAEASADGHSTLKVVVKLKDARGLPVIARTPVTLESTRGAWDWPDLDPADEGLQVMVEGGEGAFTLTAPTEPGQARIQARSGKLKADAKLDFLPELRSLIAAGVLEGIINLRRISSNAMTPVRSQDVFEQELRTLSRSSGDGQREAGARAAFFLKGKIRGDYLLTAAYDSDKDTRERLFRDIQPDEFYPVYGDSAIRGYDAQSTAKLYLRVDNRKSYLLYGDFNTLGDTNLRRLSAYSRSLTGVKEHYENGRVQANFFASRDSTSQKIDEVRANGTSGPYLLSSPAGLVNSEKVEILTRDRNRPALVLATAPQARFYDYEMEPLTGRLLFKAPVPSVDQELNPISIRITYEVDQGGPQFWVYGGDADVKVTERITVGASFAEDRNPADPFKLRGAHTVVRLGERTTVMAEVARTDRPATVGQGDAFRVHVRHDGEDLKAEAFVARTDPTFDNPGAYLSQGRGESGARAAYKIDEHLTLKAEALRTEDTRNHNVRDGFMVSAERTFANRMKLELGLRHARETGGPAIPASIIDGPGSEGTTPNDVTSVRARVTSPIPFVKDGSLYGEVEVDTQDADRRVIAVGGEYALENRGKIYVRHEFISSLTGPYGLNEQQRQNATVVGIDTEYMKDARLFSEYRIRDAISGGDAEAAIGLRNLWTLAPGLRLGTTFERVHAFSGTGQNENTAIALGLEYTASSLWKGSTRLELRDATAQQSLLHTLGYASKIGREWTVLGRNALSIQRNKGGETDGEKRILERLQAGVAFRDSDTDKLNALGRVEHREERDDTQPGIDLRRTTEILSLHADYKLSRPFLVTGHYAAKWSNEKSNGIASKYHAQAIGGRLTWEFAPKWDVGFAASGLFGESVGSRQYALGLEVGYLLATNLWLSAGYNVYGYHDDDLAAGDYTNKGAYLRLRYKFDEALLEPIVEKAR